MYDKMKTKLFDTFFFEGRVELTDCAGEIYNKTGIRTILEVPGQIVNGFLNGYYKEIEGKEYTVVDLFVYEGTRDIIDRPEKHEVRHKLRGKILKDTDRVKIKDVVYKKFGKEPSKGVKMILLGKVGNYEKK